MAARPEELVAADTPGGQRTADPLQGRGALARVQLLILDELSYVPLAPAEAELLFQVLDERSERSAIVTTTNLPFGEWTKVFPEPRLCKAVVDRLTFNAHIVETGTDSWRFKKTIERRQKKGVRRTAS